MKELSEKNWTALEKTKVPAVQFVKRREPYLRYFTYSKRFDEIFEGIRFVSQRLGSFEVGDLVFSKGEDVSAQQRLWSVLDWLSLQYSAGASVRLFATAWPYIIAWAEEYAELHDLYHQSPEAENHMTPHVVLRNEEYWIVALRLTCFGLLTGNAESISRIMRILDYCNDDMGVRDGLLERLTAPFVSGRGIPPDTATRHLPYRKLFKVFDASPDKRPALMVKYLDEWYHASRREPYIDQHGEGDFAFYGYWSWEAGAVTWLLDIDDTRYRDMPFYPRDLADFGRRTPNAAQPPSAPSPQHADTRCRHTGYWTTTARHGLRRHVEQGEIFPAIPSETTVGQTLWEWDPDQRHAAETVLSEPARVADSADAAPRSGLWLQAGNPDVRCRVAEGEPLPAVDDQLIAWLWAEQPPPGTRASTGQACPYPGIWHCEDVPVGPRAFMHGTPMPQAHGRDVTWFLVRAS